MSFLISGKWSLRTEIIFFIFLTLWHFCVPCAQRSTKRFLYVNGKQHVTCNLICEKKNSWWSLAVKWINENVDKSKGKYLKYSLCVNISVQVCISLPRSPIHIYLLCVKLCQLSLFLGEGQRGFFKALVSLLTMLKRLGAIIQVARLL